MTRWRLGDGQASERPSTLARLLERLLQGGSLWQGLERLAQVLEVLLWTLLASVVATVLWRYREWLQVSPGACACPSGVPP